MRRPILLALACAALAWAADYTVTIVTDAKASDVGIMTGLNPSLVRTSATNTIPANPISCELRVVPACCRAQVAAWRGFWASLTMFTCVQLRLSCWRWQIP